MSSIVQYNPSMSDTLAEIRKRKQAIENQIAELQRQLDAFAVVELALGGATSEVPAPAVAAQELPSPESGSAARLIRGVVRSLGEAEFTLDTVMEQLHASGIERAAVSYNLARFAKVGEISIVQEGAGRRPAIYKRIAVSGHVVHEL